MQGPWVTWDLPTARSSASSAHRRSRTSTTPSSRPSTDCSPAAWWSAAPSSRRATTSTSPRWPGSTGYLGRAIALLGLDPTAISYRMADMRPEDLASYRSGRLEQVDGGLHTLVARQVPEAGLRRARAPARHPGGIYAIGFAWDELHYGGVSIGLPRGGALDNAETIETLVHQATIVIRRLRAERELRSAPPSSMSSSPRASTSSRRRHGRLLPPAQSAVGGDPRATRSRSSTSAPVPRLRPPGRPRRHGCRPRALADGKPELQLRQPLPDAATVTTAGWSGARSRAAT